MKKGISLVALIITIIVLIILTAAVMLTGGDSPEQAKKAVFLSDASTVQEAVLLHQMNYMAAHEGAIKDITGATVVEIGGVEYKAFANVTADELNLPGITLSNWLISEDGAVIYKDALTQKSNASELLFGNGRTVSSLADATGAASKALTEYVK